MEKIYTWVYCSLNRHVEFIDLTTLKTLICLTSAAHNLKIFGTTAVKKILVSVYAMQNPLNAIYFLIDRLRNERNFEKFQNSKIHYHSIKEHLKLSKIAKFG